MWMIFIPFVILVLIYIFGFGIHYPKAPRGTIPSAIFKCLPMLYLILLIAGTPRINDKHDEYKFYMLLGMLFSVGGDWCLNWMAHYLIPGLAFFAAAQVCFTFAFGFEPTGWPSAFMFGITVLLVLSVLVPNAKPAHLKPLVVMYTILLGVMGWRATARYKDQRKLDTWFAMAGAVSFLVSDFSIGFSIWKQKFSRSMLLIMVTYYIAQMLFTVSVIQPSWRVARQHWLFF